MERAVVTESLDDFRQRMAELLHQAEQCTRQGLYRQAETLFIQLWKSSHTSDAVIASTAAWYIVCLLIRREAYAEAAVWIDHVKTPPDNTSCWSFMKQTLHRVCQMISHRLPDQVSAFISPVSRVSDVPAAPGCAPQCEASPDTPSSTLPTLQVHNLGHFQIIRNGETLPACKSHKAIAMFRFLLTRYRYRAHKEELMELLWPDAPPNKSLHSLHVTVGVLRRYLDPTLSQESYIRFEAGYYGLAPDVQIEDDCALFANLSDEGTRQMEAGHLTEAQQLYSQALAYYRGDYYIGEYHSSWSIAERERMLIHYLSVLANLGRVHSTQGAYQAAIDCYQNLLQYDAYREDVHSALMTCYVQMGRRVDAIRQYERCAALLQHDLGIDPSANIRALYDAIVKD